LRERFSHGAERLAGACALFAALCTGCGLDVRPGARTLSEALAPPSPEEAARMALDEENADNRYRGTLLLANAPFGGEPIYITMYEDYIDDEEPNVRAAATRALGNHGETRHAELVIGSLKDPEPLVRLEAARALQRLHNPIAIDALMERLAETVIVVDERSNAKKRLDVEPNTDVRAESAHALGQYADRRAVEKLIEALADRQLRVTHNALAALRTLTGQDFGLDRRAWQEWYAAAADPFAARAAYVYPVYHRDRTIFEYLPLVPPPPNEQPSSPVGMNPDLTEG
jgi:HEAT repeat protein